MERVYDMLRPKAIEISVHGKNDSLREKLTCYDSRSIGDKTFYTVPTVLLSNNFIESLGGGRELSANKNVYFALAYKKNPNLVTVSVYDKLGKILSPYERGAEKKWVKKVMYISAVYENRVYFSGWYVSLSKPDLVMNKVFLSVEPGSAACSIKCFLSHY